MQSFLITGSDEKGRQKHTENIIGKKIVSLQNSPDFILLEIGEGNSIGIAEIRDLQERLSLKPFQEKEKIALILEAQNLTTEAQNALLKTLEEPNITTKIFLTTPDSYWLLPTIVSRCEIIRLPAKPQIELDNKEFREVLDIFNKILTSSIGKQFKIVEEERIAKDRETATKFLNKLTFVIRQLLLEKYEIVSPNLPNIPNTPNYLSILQLINQYQKYLDANCNVKLALEVFLIELFSSQSSQTTSGKANGS